jgi:hypothetical protein
VGISLAEPANLIAAGPRRVQVHDFHLPATVPHAECDPAAHDWAPPICRVPRCPADRRSPILAGRQRLNAVGEQRSIINGGIAPRSCLGPSRRGAPCPLGPQRLPGEGGLPFSESDPETTGPGSARLRSRLSTPLVRRRWIRWWETRASARHASGEHRSA